MTEIRDIMEFFEEFAPLETAMDFDNCGLLVGDRERTVTSVLVSLDITPETVFEAQRLGCELIISHHPVIFQPLKRMSARSVPYLLAENGIAALCMHTNLDLSESFGVNLCLAKAAELENVRRSKKGDCLFVGELKSALPIRELAKRIKSALACEGLRYTDTRAEVKTVALCSGSGGSEVFAALEEGADALLTGEIKHHEILAANEMKVDVIDVGHFKSEDIVILPLVRKLSERFSDVKFTKSTIGGDKMKYL